MKCLVRSSSSTRTGRNVLWATARSCSPSTSRRIDGSSRPTQRFPRRWPDFKLGYIVAADTQRRYGNFPACESTLRAALSRFPDDITVQAERIRCTLMRKGVHNRASLPDIEALKALAQRDPDDPLVQEMLELIYE